MPYMNIALVALGLATVLVVIAFLMFHRISKGYPENSSGRYEIRFGNRLYKYLERTFLASLVFVVINGVAKTFHSDTVASVSSLLTTVFLILATSVVFYSCVGTTSLRILDKRTRRNENMAGLSEFNKAHSV